MPKREFRYSDLSAALKVSPINGDATVVYDTDSITQSLKSLVLTEKYERLHQPYLHGGLKRFLFEPVSSMVTEALERNIAKIIREKEPRIDLQRLTVSADAMHHRYEVSLVFKTRNTIDPISGRFFLERII